MWLAGVPCRVGLVNDRRQCWPARTAPAGRGRSWPCQPSSSWFCLHRSIPSWSVPFRRKKPRGVVGRVRETARQHGAWTAGSLPCNCVSSACASIRLIQPGWRHSGSRRWAGAGHLSVTTRSYWSHPKAARKMGSSPDLLFLRVPEGKTGKNRLHLDLRPGDQAAEVARLEGLGACRAAVGQGPDVSWVVMADPDGNEFGVLKPLPPQELDAHKPGRQATTRARSGMSAGVPTAPQHHTGDRSPWRVLAAHPLRLVPARHGHGSAGQRSLDVAQAKCQARFRRRTSPLLIQASLGRGQPEVGQLSAAAQADEHQRRGS
jgi:Glyoxalase-like domain